MLSPFFLAYFFLYVYKQLCFGWFLQNISLCGFINIAIVSSNIFIQICSNSRMEIRFTHVSVLRASDYTLDPVS